MAVSAAALTTVGFVRPQRIPAPPVVTGEIIVNRPPRPPDRAGGVALVGLLPVIAGVAMIPIMVASSRPESAAGHSPVYFAFPLVMLASVAATVLTRWSGRRGDSIGTYRDDYLEYLAVMRAQVTEAAVAQRESLLWCHPHPAALWTVIGGPRMWERRPADPDFGRVRVGVGSAPLGAALVAAPTSGRERADLVTEAALRRFLATYSSVAGVPITTTLFNRSAVVLDGDRAAARALARALLCQLAVMHGPDLVLVIAVLDDQSQDEWDWLKWLPHHQHPNVFDADGPARLQYRSLAAAESAVSTLRAEHRVALLIDGGCVDGTERIITDHLPATTIIEIGAQCARLAADEATRVRVSPTVLTVPTSDPPERRCRPDLLDVTDALVCARRLAGYRVDGSEVGGTGGRSYWANLIGIDNITGFDPTTLWNRLEAVQRLRVPVGIAESGRVVHLDIKEAAEDGTGPHGLCIGATGSGKSELLRTIALGMMVKHSPEVLNLLLVDFKGGATFLGMERSRHVAAVITNLADQAPLITRMHAALTGELSRRQELLHGAGNFVSVAAYENARRLGAPLAPLPALLVIIDEFAELLSQQPDFIDVFVAIGRLGRSLGVHLLLASQRLDEGRLRGLESHLSYRICLKTTSGAESCALLGVPDAYELPNNPGAGYLRSASGELTRFVAAFVSGAFPDNVPLHRADAEPTTVRLFSQSPSGRVEIPGMPTQPGRIERTVLETVLDRLSGQGPPARQIWLPPLGEPPTVGELLRATVDRQQLVVPIGIVDRPFQQRRTPLLVDLRAAAGNVAVVGVPQSGKSTALATLITALAATHDPRLVQFYCLDFGGGGLASLRTLPQVGSVSGLDQRDLVRRTVIEMECIVARREKLFCAHGITSMSRYRQLRAEPAPVNGPDSLDSVDRFGDVFLVIDGWAAFCRDFDMLEAPVTALAGRGLSFGVHVLLAASRWAEIRPGLRDLIGTRIELRLGEPADSELDRRQAQQVPRDRPGRGLVEGGLHMLIALPARPEPAAGGGMVAPPVPLLPVMVDRCSLVERADAAGATGRHPILGVDERELDVVTLDFGRQSHLLIFGDSESGKTSALRTLCAELLRTCPAAQVELVLVDYRRGLFDAINPDRLGGYATSAAAVTALLPGLLDRLVRRMPGPELTVQQLRERSWWSGPQLYLLVDDYDLVTCGAGNPLAPLLEYLPHAADLGLHLVVARRSGGAARAAYDPLLSTLRELGCMGLVLSGNPDEGPLIGAVRPVPLPPGRGTLVSRAGGEQLVQVAWSAPP